MSLKVLLVDDDAASVKLIRTLVAEPGHTELTFQSSREATQKAATQHINLAFLGTQAANPDAFAIACAMRDSSLNHDAMIVMLSATDEIALLRQAFAAGADVVFTKPVSANRIRSVLAAMESSGWSGKRKVRMPLFTEVGCTVGDRNLSLRSLNVSGSGMLLQPWINAEIGQEIELRFKIADVGASLQLKARIVRTDVSRFAVAFAALAPEEQNAIPVYVMGRLKDLTPSRRTADLGIRRLYPLS